MEFVSIVAGYYKLVFLICPHNKLCSVVYFS